MSEEFNPFKAAEKKQHRRWLKEQNERLKKQGGGIRIICLSPSNSDNKSRNDNQ